MFRSLSLRNFKSWHEIENMRFGRITGLFGTNSSGKTSILQWLLMLKQTVESADRAQVLNLGDERSAAQLGTFHDIVHRHEKPGTVDWEFAWELPTPLRIADPEGRARPLFSDSSLAFSCTVTEEPTGRLRVRKLTYAFAAHDFTLAYDEGKRRYRLSVKGNTNFDFRRSVGRPWELPAPVKCYGFPDQVNSFYQNAGFLPDLQLALEEQFSQLFYLGPLRDYPRRQYIWGGAQPADMGQRGERVIDALLASRERGEKISRGKGHRRFTVEEYVAYWLRELGLISSFSVEKIAKGSNLYQVRVKKNPSSAPVLITDVGFGVSQILPVLALCYYVPEHSTIILEQPEIHLHPSVQAGLADVLVDAVKIKQVQIMVESHSEYLLRRLQRRIAEEVLSSDEVVLYFCDIQDGTSNLLSLDVDMFGNIRNWPKGFFGDEFGEMAAITRAAMQRQMKQGA